MNSKHIVIITPFGKGINANILEERVNSVSAAKQRYNGKIDDDKKAEITWIISTSNHNDVDNFKNLLKNHSGIKKYFGNVKDIFPGDAATAGEVNILNLGVDHASAATNRNMAALSAMFTGVHNNDIILVNADADDVFFSNRLAEVHNDFFAHNDGNVSSVDYAFYAADDLVENEFGTYVFKRWDSIFEEKIYLEKDWAKKEVNGHNVLRNTYTASLAIRKSVLFAAGGYPAYPYMEDTVLAYALEKSDFVGLYNPTKTWLYRNRKGSLSHSNSYNEINMRTLLTDANIV